MSTIPDVCWSAGELLWKPFWNTRICYLIRVLLSVGEDSSRSFLSLECWVINHLSAFGLPGCGRNGSYHASGYRLWLLVIISPPFWLSFLRPWVSYWTWGFIQWLFPCEAWTSGILWDLLGTSRAEPLRGHWGSAVSFTCFPSHKSLLKYMMFTPSYLGFTVWSKAVKWQLSMALIENDVTVVL